MHTEAAASVLLKGTRQQYQSCVWALRVCALPCLDNPSCSLGDAGKCAEHSGAQGTLFDTEPCTIAAPIGYLQTQIKFLTLMMLIQQLTLLLLLLMLSFSVRCRWLVSATLT